MSRHINPAGQFQSDLHPELPPDKIILSFKDEAARPALKVLALNYKRADPEFAEDILDRLETIAASSNG